MNAIPNQIIFYSNIWDQINIIYIIFEDYSELFSKVH